MALQKREKRLVSLTGGLFAALAIVYLWPSGGLSLAELRSRCRDLEKKVEEKQRIVSNARPAAAQLAAWQKRALPANPERAGTRYYSWLQDLVVDRVEFDDARVEPGEIPLRRGDYVQFSYTVRGDATLEQLARFLYEFYQAGHLHKVRRLEIKPRENASRLDLTIMLEALSLPEADRRDQLTSAPGNHLQEKSFDQYKKQIVGRNLFAAYTPPKPPPKPKEVKEPPKPPEFDHAAFTYVTGIVETDGRSEAWLHIRPQGKTLKVHEGEPFTVGTKKYKVLKIGRRAIKVESNGQSRIVPYGESLKPESE